MKQVQCSGSIVRADDTVARILENRAQLFSRIFVVVNDQDGGILFGGNGSRHVSIRKRLKANEDTNVKKCPVE